MFKLRKYAAINRTYSTHVLLWFVQVERRWLAGQSWRRFRDDVPRVQDVVVAGVDGADGEANDIVIVDDRGHHVQLPGHIDCS